MPHRLAICMPIYRTVEAETALCLARLVRHEVSRGTHVEIMGSVGSLVMWARCELAKAAINANCSHILWIDSDMTFPEYAAEHLLSLDLPIVGANCVFRDGSDFTAEKYGKKIQTTTSSTGRISCDQIGLALALVKSEIFEKLSPPWFDVVDSGNHRVGEDYYFCSRVRNDLGIRPHIDHDLSKVVFHLGTIKLGVACGEA